MLSCFLVSNRGQIIRVELVYVILSIPLDSASQSWSASDYFLVIRLMIGQLRPISQLRLDYDTTTTKNN